MQINRRKDAPRDGQKMRRKNKILRRKRQLLEHFRQMAVMENAIRPQVFVHLGKMQLVAGLAARSGCAGFGIGNDPRSNVHPACLEQRRKRQDHGGGVASGIRDQARLGNRGRIKFRNAVNRLGQCVRGGVIKTVPVLVGGGVLQPESATQIHYAQAAFQKAWHDLVRGFVRSGEKNHLGA